MTPTYPGVYIQEGASSSHVINGVTTSDTAFVDVFEKGPVDTPTRVTNFGEFRSMFGDVRPESTASYGIFQFFLNGGAVAWVVRVAPAEAVAAQLRTDNVELQAVGPGTWANFLQAATQPAANPNAHAGEFDLVVREVSPGTASNANERVVASEVFQGVSADQTDPNYVKIVLENQSTTVRMLAGSTPTPAQPPPTPIPASDSITSPGNISDPTNPEFTAVSEKGTDVYTIGPNDLGAEAEPGPPVVPATGFYTLEDIAPNVFNILCLPAMSALPATEWQGVFERAFEFCEKQRAFFVADPPTAVISDENPNPLEQVNSVKAWFTGTVTNKTNHAAAYFPRLKIVDPNGGPTPIHTEASGTLAGSYARTDASQGVWKAPAGTEAVLDGVVSPVVEVDDTDNGTLNELGLNCIRTFPVVGTVSWGARTTDGADLLQSPWKYIPVRRTALYIEQSLHQGTTWAVFEPNDERLWSSLRHSVGIFMDGLYKQGAFAGSSAKDAYFVKCDATTTTPADVQQDRVNLTVGFAPLRPAEFLVITITLNMGQ